MNNIKRLTEEKITELYALFDEDELTASKFARLCCVDRSTVYRAISNGELTVIEGESEKEKIIIEPFRKNNLIFLSMCMENFSERTVQVIGREKNGNLIYCPLFLEWQKLYDSIIREIRLIQKEEKEEKEKEIKNKMNKGVKKI